MAANKQDRTVNYIKLSADHHYFGSIKALSGHFGKV